MKPLTGRYIFDPQKPGSIPPELVPSLNEHGISEEILLCFATDLSPCQFKSDCYILMTEQYLYRICGVKGVEGASGKRPIRVFTESDFTRWNRAELSAFSVEELVSSLRLTACKGEEKLLLAMGSLSCRGDVHIALDYLKQYSEKGSFSLAERKRGRAEEQFCPKCGRRYPDPARNLCPACEKRSRIILRTASLFKSYRLKICLLILGLVASGGLSVLAPYLSAGFFYDRVLNENGSLYGQIGLVIFLIVATRILSELMNAGYYALSSVVAADMTYDLKKVIFSSINRLSVSFFTSRKTGGLMTQVNSDARTVYWFFCDGFPYFVVHIVQVLAAATVMLMINPLLALAALIPIPLAAVICRYAYKKLDVLHNRSFSKRRSLNGSLSDMLGGVRVVKAFSGEQQEKERFGQKNGALADAEFEVTKYRVRVFPIAELLLNLGSTLVWAVGGVMILSHFVGPSVTGGSVITYGTLATFVAYAGITYNHLFYFVEMISDTVDSVNAMSRLIEIMDAKAEVEEKEDALSFEKMRGEISFEHVSFSYEPGHKVLENVSFRLEAGKTLGIVGKTGAGKSTLVNLLVRLYDVTEGSIRIDGTDVRDLKTAYLRKNVAVVSQDTYLFVGTILENVRYAKPEASLKEVVDACIASGAHEFIMKLKDGYDTRIGQGYQDLSGGERQRLSIARAILKDPVILILDEATAAMDTRTEQTVQRAISALSKEKTTVIIAHRLSTLRDADKLIVIDKNTVAEEGTPGELIRAKGVYYTLYKMQLEALKIIGIKEDQ